MTTAARAPAGEPIRADRTPSRDDTPSPERSPSRDDPPSRDDTPSPDRTVPPQRDVALAVYQRTRRVIGSVALTRLLLAIPRTLRYMADNLDRRLAGVEDDVPVPRLTGSHTAQVALDEAILALAMGPNRFPRRRDYERVGAELRAFRALATAEGWLADPARYHRAPPPLTDPVVQPATTLTSANPPLIRFERAVWHSAFEPRPGEPGRERWLSYEPNRTAAAWLLREHPGRPWLIGVHGFGMGYPMLDFGAFEGRTLHDELRLNLALPVLPLHGDRKVTPLSGEAFLSFDLVNTVHGLAQAVWDLRRLVSYLRTQTDAPIGVYGVSLGAYVAALLACLEPELVTVIAGIPVADFPALFESHSPAHIRLRAVSHDLIGAAASEVHRLVSPLAMPCRVPHAGRFVYAGLADRVVKPGQAQRLWEHWERPERCWYAGNHVGYLWSGEVRRFVRRALRRGLLGEEGG